MIWLECLIISDDDYIDLFKKIGIYLIDSMYTKE